MNCTSIGGEGDWVKDPIAEGTTIGWIIHGREEYPEPQYIYS